MYTDIRVEVPLEQKVSFDFLGIDEKYEVKFIQPQVVNIFFNKNLLNVQK